MHASTTRARDGFGNHDGLPHVVRLSSDPQVDLPVIQGVAVQMVNDARVSRANAHNLPVHPQRDVSAVDASISDRIEMVAGAVPFCFPAPTVKPLMVPGVHDSETVLADGMLSVKLNCAEAHLNSQSRRPGALGACSRSKSSSPASESAAASSQ
jgi:hypothetical protein